MYSTGQDNRENNSNEKDSNKGNYEDIKDAWGNQEIHHDQSTSNNDNLGSEQKTEKKSLSKRVSSFIITIIIIVIIFFISTQITYISSETGKTNEEIIENFISYIEEVNFSALDFDIFNIYPYFTPYVPECDYDHQNDPDPHKFNDCYNKVIEALDIKNEYKPSKEAMKDQCLIHKVIGYRYDDCKSRYYYKNGCLGSDISIVDECYPE